MTLKVSHIFRVGAVLLLSTAASAAERPWQSLTNPKAAELATAFREPPPEYGVTLWWGWDGPMDEAVITRDLDAIRAKGLRSVLIEAGYGMSAPYLSPGWFERVRFAVAEARRRGMRVWIEDEGKYPSGFAGGKFSAERPDLRMQSLVVAARIEVASGETVARKVSADTVGALAVNQNDSSSQVLDVSSGELHWSTPGGQWYVLLIEHQFRTSVTRSVNNPTRGKDATNSLCDYLNPAATRQFLDWTHEQYAKAFGDELGRTFMGIMGDEPDFAFTPWTPAILSEFEKRKGYDVRPHLAAFFGPRLSDEQKRARADYWDVWSDLFRDSFFRVQADWCASKGIEYIVHLNHEDKMMDLVRSEGDYFKDMRYVQVPGIDTIWNQIWPGNVSDFPKYASSAAHVFGRPRAFTESFAAYRTPPTPEQAKWVIDYQLARGVNFVQLMFVSSSANPEGGFRGWMASDKFPGVVEYANRATYLLAQGRPTASIAVYYPTLSLWLGDEKADASTLALMRGLLERQRDFDFVDEQALSSVLTLEAGVLRGLSGNEYRAVVVPGARAISRAALERLRAFAQSGGRVVFLGQTPSLVVGGSFLKAETPRADDFDWAIVEASGDLTPRVLAALPAPDVIADPPAPGVKCIERRWQDADLYFLFNESDERQSVRLSFHGVGWPEVWDAVSGRIEPMAERESDRMETLRLPVVIEPHESRFIVQRGSADRRLP